MTGGIRPSELKQWTCDFCLKMPHLWSVMPMDMGVILAPHTFRQQANKDHQLTPCIPVIILHLSSVPKKHYFATMIALLSMN